MKPSRLTRAIALTVAIGAGASAAGTFRYHESFDGFAEQSPAAAAGWALLTDAGTARDNASGTVSNSLAVPGADLPQFADTGASVIDVEVAFS